MSDVKAIQKIYPYSMKWGELAALSDEDKAVFAMLSFASSEINALRRLSLLSMNELPNLPIVEQAIDIQRNFLLRTMTAKLFEFIEFFNAVKKRRPAPQQTVEVFKTFSAEMKKITTHIGYPIAKRIRNKIANHYDLDSAISSGKAITDNFICSLCFTPESGNNYFPMGDSIIFSNPAEEYVGQNGVKLNSSEMVYQWVQWTLLASGVVEKLHTATFEAVILPIFKHRKAYERIEYLPDKLKVNSNDYMLPVFVRANS